jgi:MATE family multidrug resistance protein
MPTQSLPKHSLSSLLSLAWPIIVSRSTQVVMGLADALFVAHLGENALASVTAGAMNSAAVFIFPMGVSFIVASFSSQLAGRGESAAARRYGWYGLAVAALAQVLALLAIPWLPTVFGSLHYAPALVDGLCAYLSIRLLSTGVAVGIEALGNYYSGLGRTAMVMRANLAAMLLNILFLWFLVDGHAGFPALGIRGAAWSNLLATGLAFAGFFAAFLWQGRGLGRLGLKAGEFTRMLRFGLPSGLNWSFEFFAFIAFVNVVVGSLGTSALAALMAVIQINSVAFMPAFGLGSAGAILVGQSIGAGHKDQVPALVRLTFLTSAAWMLMVALVYVSMPARLLGPFVPGQAADNAFVAAGVAMLFLSAFWQVFDAAGITLGEALRAAGDTVFPMWARGILAWGVFLPGSWIQVRYFGGGVRSAVAWLMVYLGLLSLALFLRYQGGAWRRIELMEAKLPVA